MADTSDPLYKQRHSLAHLTAAAVQRLWPQAKFGVGPVIDNGFYYDIDLGDKTLSEEDLPAIESEIQKLIQDNITVEQFDKPIDEAIEWAKASNQPYKQELLNDLKRSGTTAAKDINPDDLGVASQGEGQIASVSFYKIGEFTDLCRGPHVSNSRDAGVFKLTKVAGAYWRGNEKNPQMQRIYGVGFASQQDLDNYLHLQEEAKARDHRKVGRELDLFTFSDLVGSGLPLWTPRGTILKDKLNGLSQQLRRDVGYQAVTIPYLTKPDLYKTSGHWDKFGDELFLVESQETSDSFVLKPMNCPHHTQIYASQPRSYKELPIRYMETTGQYRDEKTGELHGLSRVRSITIDDCHAFCREEQIEQVANELIEKALYIYEQVGMKLRFRLSFRDDGEGYLGDKALWDKAQAIIEQLAKDNKLDYFVAPGEAAFYGPKIDYIAEDSLGREWQLATVQVDFVQPERFGLEYTDENGQAKRPVMIHSALLGSAERFLSVYIEHTSGWFPFWMAPEQVRILSINDSVEGYIDEIEAVLRGIVLDKPLKYNELRYSIDSRNESLGKKIKEASAYKIPVQLIIGPKDVEARQISIRLKDKEEKIPFDELKSYIENHQ